MATDAGNEGRYIDEAGVSVVEIPGWQTTGKAQYYETAAKKIEEAQPDLLYIRNFLDNSYLANICQAKGIPYVTLSVHSMETSPFLLGYHPKESISYIYSGMAWEHFKSFRAAGFHDRSNQKPV